LRDDIPQPCCALELMNRSHTGRLLRVVHGRAAVPIFHAQVDVAALEQRAERLEGDGEER
jgi:hypothetical protein